MDDEIGNVCVGHVIVRWEHGKPDTVKSGPHEPTDGVWGMPIIASDRYPLPTLQICKHCGCVYLEVPDGG